MSEKTTEKEEAAPPSQDVLGNILFTLKTLQIQNKKLAKYHDTNYDWHLQHHNNLKKIMASINKIYRVLDSQGKARLDSIEPDENPALLNMRAQSSSSSSSSGERLSLSRSVEKEKPRSAVLDTFHSFVMSFRNNVRSAELEKALLSITNEQFQELQEESFEVILPLMVSWLRGTLYRYMVTLAVVDDTTKRDTALVIIFETSKKHPEVFKKAKNRAIVRKCTEAFDALSTTYLYSLCGSAFETEEELDSLRTFLYKCLT